MLFNWKYLIAKSNALDYSIVHVMCHTYHKNHSKGFGRF
ncbi:YgjP-like metallopeptidase domain-containing protein [Clostridium estertheticum]